MRVRNIREDVILSPEGEHFFFVAFWWSDFFGGEFLSAAVWRVYWFKSPTGFQKKQKNTKS